jgi:hypothetical protein
VAERQVEAIKEPNALDGRWITLLWVSLLAIGGGTLRLLLDPRGSLHIILAGIGLLLMVALLSAVLIFDRRMRGRTRTLQEDL